MSLARIRVGLASLIVFSATIGGAAPAYADDGDVVNVLCSDPIIGCSVTGPASTIRDATVIDVSVTGSPNTHGTLLVYRAVLQGDKLAALEPISKPTPFTTNAGGVSSSRVVIPGTGKLGREGGWVFISLAGQRGTDVSSSVGEFLPFAARIPHLLGDGYATEKPVGMPLEMHADGAVDSADFVVEYNDGGVWKNVTAATPDAIRVADRPDGISVFTYQVPRGLQGDREYEFRVRNITDTAVTASWKVRPSVKGVKQQRAPQFHPPAVGTDLAGAQRQTLHPESAVKTVALTLTGVGTLAMLGSAPIVRRRRG